jgi:hypothetical protein
MYIALYKMYLTSKYDAARLSLNSAVQVDMAGAILLAHMAEIRRVRLFNALSVSAVRVIAAIVGDFRTHIDVIKEWTGISERRVSVRYPRVGNSDIKPDGRLHSVSRGKPVVSGI